MRTEWIENQLSRKEMRFIVGFAVGTVFGVYLAQNYNVPKVNKYIETLKKKARDLRDEGFER